MAQLCRNSRRKRAKIWYKETRRVCRNVENTQIMQIRNKRQRYNGELVQKKAKENKFCDNGNRKNNKNV